VGNPETDAERERFWKDYLTRGDPRERRIRALLGLLPGDPRCQLCAAPFAGPSAPVMRMLGKRPADKNPRTCQTCFDFMAAHHGGAEIEVSFLFADIRGSTTLGEHMSPAAFHELLDRFYATANRVVFANDGNVDKFVGDEVVALFFPLLSGPSHAAKAIRAAEGLLRATGHDEPGGPWVPVGIGVHTGLAWVGAVGDDAHTELTALGDAVNTTARLASAAAAGEILVTVNAAEAAALAGDHERRSLQLRGKETLTEVIILRIGLVHAASDEAGEELV
jgi:adenylate cyclase